MASASASVSASAHPSPAADAVNGHGRAADTGPNGANGGGPHGANRANGNGNDNDDDNGTANTHPIATSSTNVDDSPPAQICSDIPGVSAASPSPSPSTSTSTSTSTTANTNAPAPAPAPAPARSSPSVNGLNIHPSSVRANRSNQVSHSPALPSSAPTTTGTSTGTAGTAGSTGNVAIPPKSTVAKSPIVNAAPGIGTPSPAPRPSSGFPSPGRDSLYATPKFVDDRTRITYGIQQALPAAARRSVRDNWEKCLLGSDFHQAFVVSPLPQHHLSQGEN